MLRISMTSIAAKRFGITLATLLLASAACAATKYKVLHSFKGPPDGAAAWAGVTIDNKGDLYGTTLGGGTGNECGNSGCGTVFELTPKGSGKRKERVVHSFNNPAAFFG